ncbi:hypothetical protein [Pseudalkalibacillus salsuginis]|uniref:hypothetical protein n=1 Tax=Pseudalkalibacillus salsuginis TaxID=2910972 RepID=UPI001F4622EF|nr:hypothetical protein [Pseudalkalibacillus salsuginis]MCF6409405.1 hypothetical protein [Pseudalkalibacillus salsuginis]
MLALFLLKGAIFVGLYIKKQEAGRSGYGKKGIYAVVNGVQKNDRIFVLTKISSKIFAT